MKVLAGSKPTIAVIGGGPAGLMAAEAAVARSVQVHLYDAMASVGRKFLLAGKGGLNLTHSELPDSFIHRYGARAAVLRPIIDRFGPKQLQAWASELGFETFVGSSGRVFPKELKAAPLLRAWLRRLREQGVVFHMHHRWRGWTASGALRMSGPEGEVELKADAVVLALGGASWSKLGSDGAWVSWLRDRGVHVHELKPSNCGFDVPWSVHMQERYAGQPVKPVTLAIAHDDGRLFRQGEFVITRNGVEGGVIYALSAVLRECIERDGEATIFLDLAPGREPGSLVEALSKPRGKHSMAKHLKRCASIEGVKAALLHEVLPPAAFNDAALLTAAIKSLPIRLLAARPLDEAISTAGGVCFDDLDSSLMLRAMPGVFCAGEMLDWEAPTGGYLLTACMATGRTAGIGAADWLALSTKR
ncbi:MAG: TIGR03862 family flavoprotein [Gammaproteobacteria bacterium]